MGEVRKKRFGDRRDGRRLRNLSPIIAMTSYIMKTRNDATNYFKDSVEVTEAERFLRMKRTQGYPGMGFLHLFIALYLRLASQYPAINRFVSGQRVYARSRIECVMIVKRALKTQSDETSIKVVFDPADTINEVYRKMNEQIEKVKNDSDATEADDAASSLMKLPRLILKFAMFVLNVLDYFDLMPKSLISASPFHGSVFITDLGSIGLPTIYHHLYNFGNIPLFISFGAKRKALVMSKDGAVSEKKFLDYTISADERICDGFYFSQMFRVFKSILRNPQMLDNPPETVAEDVS